MIRKSYIFIIVLLVVLASCITWGYTAFYGNCVRSERSLYVYRDCDYDSLVRLIEPDIKHRTAFGIYARRINLASTFRAGHYRLEKGMSVIDVARMLKLGIETPVRVTINNVRTPAELAGKVARQLEADSVSFLRAFTSDSLARTVGFDSLRLFSMFIPNTYELYWTVTPDQFVRRMRREYDAFWTPERDAKLGRLKMDRYEVMTLASILYEETKAVDEMPRIAGVYVNRLQRGIPLQAMPDGKVCHAGFYVAPGVAQAPALSIAIQYLSQQRLPPSPICMPSIAAIDAVLDYEKHQYLFFCARPEMDGHHNFARTLREHNANGRAYAAALDRLQIK